MHMWVWSGGVVLVGLGVCCIFFIYLFFFFLVVVICNDMLLQNVNSKVRTFRLGHGVNRGLFVGNVRNMQSMSCRSHVRILHLRM